MNGRFVLPERVFEGDVAIAEGKISCIGRNLSGDEKVDLEGRYVLPGLIDVHVHFREPGENSKEDWLTGSSAAAAGGVTTVLEMPNTNPPTVTKQLLDDKRKLASRSVVDYGFHFGASTGNIEEIRRIERIASVKFYTGSTTGSLLVESDAVFFEQLKVLAERGLPASVHAEDAKMIEENMQRLRSACRMDAEAYSAARPGKAALEAAKKVISFSKTAKNRLHLCHVSTRAEVDLIAAHKKQLDLTAEATPHHLFLTRKDYAKLGSLAKTNPPLRSEADRKALWNALEDGVIDLVASDHAPHPKESKEQDIWTAPAGVPGLETMLPLLLNEVNKKNLTLRQTARLTAENPARIFSIKNKGMIREGFDADFVVIDLKTERTVDETKLHTKCAWSPFSGRKLKGWPHTTYVRGKIACIDGIIQKTKGEEVCYDQTT
ncbi:MAG: dihydroorotase family protein [Candidatus Altiarchaeota archaeon]|nr:dihydroorotase family protein [Candidatus Altiarchaeota archaeon]